MILLIFPDAHGVVLFAGMQVYSSNRVIYQVIQSRNSYGYIYDLQ